MNFGDFVLVGTTDDLMQEKRVRGIADAIEFRIDQAEKPLAALEEYSGELPIIAGICPDNNGSLNPDYLDTLLASVEIDAVHAIDISLEKVRQNKDLVEVLTNSEADLIVSYYNFEHTPDQETLLEIAEEANSYGDIAKIMAMAQDIEDAITVLSFVDKCDNTDIPVSGTSLGPAGSHTRVIAPLYGSRIGYAPIDTDSDDSFSGEFPLEELNLLIEKARYEDNEIELHDMLKNNSKFQSGN